MSGLLVKSTVVMKENLEEMNAQNASDIPVILGGAALTRSYVEHDLDNIYAGDVHYARDAFEGLSLMDEIMARKRGETITEDVTKQRKKAERKARRERSQKIAAERKAKAKPVQLPERSRWLRTSRWPPHRSGAPGSSRACPCPTTCPCWTSGLSSWGSGG